MLRGHTAVPVRVGAAGGGVPRAGSGLCTPFFFDFVSAFLAKIYGNAYIISVCAYGIMGASRSDGSHGPQLSRSPSQLLVV